MNWTSHGSTTRASSPTCTAPDPRTSASRRWPSWATAGRSTSWIGMSATSVHQDEAFSEMTGVLAPHRGKGLSLALKLLAIRFARAAGCQRLVAFHHPENHTAIAMNRRLGFVDQAR
ncbi:GNAT family N-acetyltransferase [Actinoplanes awajinensis]